MRYTVNHQHHGEPLVNNFTGSGFEPQMSANSTHTSSRAPGRRLFIDFLVSGGVQVYKLIYACRLAEAGLNAQAFHYCEIISKAVLMQPSYHSPVIISQLIQVHMELYASLGLLVSPI